MNIALLFIRRPVMTLLVMAGILIFGIIAYRLLPVNALPNVDFPTIQVQAQLPGASPETMASAVATPLEKQFSTIAGIDSMTSVSTDGQTTVTLQFTLDRSIDAAAQDVQSAIAAAAKSLPSSMPTPPTQRKVNPADAPIMNIVLSSTTLPLSTVAEYAENMLAQQVSTISGVAQVGVFGSAAVRRPDPARPQRHGDARHRHHRRRAGHRQQQRQFADRHALRRRPRDFGAGNRPADECGGVSRR